MATDFNVPTIAVLTFPSTVFTQRKHGSFSEISVLGRDHGRMRAAGFRHGAEAAEPVRDDARRGLQMRLRHQLDLGAVVNLHDMQQQSQRPPVIAGLDGHDERGLVGPERPRLPPSSSLFRMVKFERDLICLCT
jgi:hypothetical protein